jgi:DNA-3-methyladenine glycosylase
LKLERILQLSSVEAAPLLLGCTLSRQTPEGTLSLKIVETEAYRQDDPASHSFAGLTNRTAPMFEEGGYIYVYFTYGMHYCVNIVVGKKGIGEAVLIRAGEPLEGVEIMKKHRGINNIYQLTNGPAKLTQALGIISTELSGKKIGPKTLQLYLSGDPVTKKL